MKVAYVLGKFPVLSETFIGEEMRAIEKLGHEIFPIALHRPDAPFQQADQELADRTFYFSEISAAESKRLLKRYYFKQHLARAFIRSQHEPHIPLLVHAAQLADLIHEKGCTHIHAHFAWGATAFAIATAKLLRMPVTFTCHGSDVYARPQDLIAKCQYADAVFAVAPTITADIQKLAGTPCHTVFCGVDTGRFAPSQSKHARWLFVGRLVDCKGVVDILAALKSLPEDKRPLLDIVGDGQDAELLHDYVRQHALQNYVSFLGSKSSAWIAEHGPSYRAFVAPFKQGRDGSRDTAPQVLKEAMAMGLPIVTTEFVDIQEVVDNNCALFCPPGDIGALARALLQMENLPQEKQQAMGEAGRKRVKERFTLIKQATEMLALWSALASN